MTAPVLRDERGSAVVEFVVSGLVVFLFMAVFQLGLVLHIRNTLISCASEGARLGARADAEPGMGVTRTRELIESSPADDYADNVTVGTGVVGGVQVVEVHGRAPFSVIGLLVPDGRLGVTGRAFLERQISGGRDEQPSFASASGPVAHRGRRDRRVHLPRRPHAHTARAQAASA